MWKPKKAEPTRVRTPLPSQAQREGEDGAQPQSASPYLRAENEDDDGYDPYSDRREESPLFEANPWE